MPKKTPGQGNRGAKKAAYLRAYRKVGGMVLAAEAVGVHHNTVWEWRKDDPEFAAAFDAAKEVDTEKLEASARRRAASKSDLLAIFLLKARRPEVYRDNVKVEHAGQVSLADFFRPADARGAKREDKA